MAQLDIVHGNVPITGETEGYIRERAEHLETFHARIMSCRVAVDAPTAHHRHGGPYRVTLDIAVPGKVIAVNHRQADELHVAIRKAFEAAQRQLATHAKTHRHEVRQQPTAQLDGTIVRLFSHDGYGFIEASDGREIYFAQNSLVGLEFGDLQVGTAVHFVEVETEQGPQASTVEGR